MMKRTKCEVEKERGSLERGRKEFPDKNSVTKQRKLRQSLRQLYRQFSKMRQVHEVKIILFGKIESHERVFGDRG